MHRCVSKGTIAIALAALRVLRGKIRVPRHWTEDLGMTLAAILLVTMMYGPSSATAARRQDAPQSAPSTTAPEAAPKQDQGTTPAAQNPPASSQPPPATEKSTKTPSGQTASTATTRSHHKKRVLPPCPSVPAGGQATTDSRASTANPSTAGSTAAAGTPSPCPPSKVVVRHGGTSEPGVQLAGGTANQTAHQRDVANQILGATDANLKKVAGRQLTASQQDTVSQIRQFMGQSKEAIDAGDLERARTLAWKAEVLSEDLVKPQK